MSYSYQKLGNVRNHATVMAAALGVTLVASPAHGQASPARDGEERLSTQIIVQGKVEGYKAPNASSSTRTDTPILETPQSISVLSRQAMEDLQAARIEDVLDYAGGFTRGNNFGGLGLTDYNLRGFNTSEYFRNGFPINRGYPSAPDSITVERVEVLRGPAALLYGRGDPGGTFNMVTRQPEREASYSANARLNTYGAWRLAADATGELTASGNLRYRVGAAAEGGGSFRDHVDSKRYVVAPSIAWDPGANTTITLAGEFVESHSPLDRGLPNYANFSASSLPRSRFLGEPDVGNWRVRNGLGELRIEHRLGGDWLLRAGVQYYNGDLGGGGVEFNSVRADGRTLVRNYSERHLGWSDLDAQINLTGKFATGGIEHTVLIGAEYEKYHYVQTIRRSTPATHPFGIDMFNPVYGQALPPLTAALSDTTADAKTYAFYAQDQISVNEWLRLIGGVRVERYESASFNRVNRSGSDFTQTVVTPRLGVVVLLARNLSVYGSYARSNKPNTAIDRNGQILAPERGTSYEAGVKLDLFGGAFSLTTAAFHTVKQNVSTRDPQDENFSIAAGEVRSRGIDLTFAGAITRGWRVTGGYAFVDAEVTKDNRLPLGQPLPNTPRHSFSMLNVYEFQHGPLRGLDVGAGVTHVGKRIAGSAATAPKMDGYTTVNLLAYYDLAKDTRLQVNVTNLFNKRYDERAFGNSLYPGAPLTGVFSISTKF